MKNFLKVLAFGLVTPILAATAAENKSDPVADAPTAGFLSATRHAPPKKYMTFNFGNEDKIKAEQQWTDAKIEITAYTGPSPLQLSFIQNSGSAAPISLLRIMTEIPPLTNIDTLSYTGPTTSSNLFPSRESPFVKGLLFPNLKRLYIFNNKPKLLHEDSDAVLTLAGFARHLGHKNAPTKLNHFPNLTRVQLRGFITVENLGIAEIRTIMGTAIAPAFPHSGAKDLVIWDGFDPGTNKLTVIINPIIDDPNNPTATSFDPLSNLLTNVAMWVSQKICSIDVFEVHTHNESFFKALQTVFAELRENKASSTTIAPSVIPDGIDPKIYRLLKERIVFLAHGAENMALRPRVVFIGSEPTTAGATAARARPAAAAAAPRSLSDSLAPY